MLSMPEIDSEILIAEFCERTDLSIGGSGQA
jgi:hypothetical protein